MNKLQHFTFTTEDNIAETVSLWLRQNQNIDIIHAQWLQQGETLHYFILYHRHYSEWDTTPCVNC